MRVTCPRCLHSGNPKITSTVIPHGDTEVSCSFLYFCKECDYGFASEHFERETKIKEFINRLPRLQEKGGIQR